MLCYRIEVRGKMVCCRGRESESVVLCCVMCLVSE